MILDMVINFVQIAKTLAYVIAEFLSYPVVPYL